MQSVVKTMKTLAAVNIRQYEQAVEALSRFNKTIETGIQAVIRTEPQSTKPPKNKPGENKTGIIILGSEQGMAGQFNEQIARFAYEQIQAESKEKKQVVVVFGEQALGRVEDYGIPVDSALPIPNSLAGLSYGMQELLFHIERWRFKENVDRILIYYNSPISGTSFEQEEKQLLPLDRQWLQSLRSKKWKTRAVPFFSMEKQQLFSSLIRQYIYASIVRAFVDSLASENASRLASMQVAEKNIAEHIDELRAKYNHQRQESITAELLDIVSGFEALTGKGKK